MSSNHYFFCFQITAVINKIEKNTQRDLNFIFYEISEYVKFFVLKCFLRKKTVTEHKFRENDVACEVHEKLWGIPVSSNNLAHNGFATVSTI